MIQCGLASGHRVWYLATEGKEWREKFALLLRQHDTGTTARALPKISSDQMLTSMVRAGLTINRGGGRESKRRGVKLLFLDSDEIERNSIEGTPHPACQSTTSSLIYCLTAFLSVGKNKTQGRGMR